MDQIAVALIGFGEAGRSFAEAGSWSTSARVFDVLTDDPASADRKRREYLAAGVAGSDTLADAVSRSVFVKVALPASAARSGQFARLQVAAGTAEIVAVPSSALTRFGQMERVWIVVEGRASLQLVQTGRARGESLEIISGLSAGDIVVLAPPASLREGQRVTVQP